MERQAEKTGVMERQAGSKCRGRMSPVETALVHWRPLTGPMERQVEKTGEAG